MKKIAAIILMAFLLTACGTFELSAMSVDPDAATATGEAYQKPDPAVAATDEPTPQLTAAPADEPTVASDQPDVVFAGGSLSYDESLAGSAAVQTVPTVTESRPGEMAAPEHIEIVLEGYALSGTLHAPRIIIYPVDELVAVNEQAAAAVAQLQSLLDRQPEQTPSGGFQGSTLPFLPQFNAGQVLRTQIAYLDFNGGHGIRYLTQFDQAMLPINNRSLFYTFQGLTDNGDVYVAAILPVSHSSLPADEMGMGFTGDEQEDFINNFDSYILDIAQQLNAQSSDSFNPDLTLLDAMLQSLTFD